MRYMCMYPVEVGNSAASFEYAGVNAAGQLAEESSDRGMIPVGTTNKVTITKREGDYSPLKEIDDDIGVSVFVTDSRIAFYCKEYDKGSTYWGIGGGAGIALIMTTVSKSRAEKRTAGTVMVGHVRYEWLRSVTYEKKRNWFTWDSIQLEYTDSDGTEWDVYLEFFKGINAEQVANDIIQKACRYKLAVNIAKTDEERAVLSAYSQGKTIPPPASVESSKSDELAAYPAPSGGDINQSAVQSQTSRQQAQPAPSQYAQLAPSQYAQPQTGTGTHNQSDADTAQEVQATQAAQNSLFIILKGQRFPLLSGRVIYQYYFDETCYDKTRQTGLVRSKPDAPQDIGIKNVSGLAWYVKRPGEDMKQIAPRSTVRIVTGTLITIENNTLEVI